MNDLIMDAPTGHAKRPKRPKHPNSLTTYWDQVLPTLRPRQKAVLEVILAHPGGITSKEIAREMKVEWHTISGRPGELVKLGVIRGTGQKRDGSEILVSCKPSAPVQQSLWQGAA